MEATTAELAWTTALGAVTARFSDCFERREPRELVREMCEAMLMELDTRNCWTLAEALGHSGPHRLQHLLSRAVFDHDTAADRIATWTASELADPNAVLIVDETGDEKSSTDCVGAAHQYSGALDGVGLCQVAVHLTYASRHGRAPIGRTLYFGKDWAGDEERRLLAGVPDEITFATKPQQAAAMLARARDLGIPACWLAGDEVYGCRRTCERGPGKISVKVGLSPCVGDAPSRMTALSASVMTSYGSCLRTSMRCGWTECGWRAAWSASQPAPAS